MLTMATTGMLISAVQGVAPEINVPSALLTSYLVITSLLTVRPFDQRPRWTDVSGMLTGLGIGIGCFVLVISAIADGGARAGLAFPLVLFGAVALAASAGDRGMIRAGGLQGAQRLKRHLWRMCFALFIASIAFFLGRGRVPAPFNTPAVLATGVLFPIAAMFYWLLRLRVKRPARRVPRTVAEPA